MSWIRHSAGLKSAEDTGTLQLPRRTYGQGRRRDIRGEGSSIKREVLLPLPMKYNENILPKKNASSFYSEVGNNDKENEIWEDVGECTVNTYMSEDDLSLHGKNSLLGAVRLKKQLNAKELSFSCSCSSSSYVSSHEREEEEEGTCKEENSLLTCSNSISHEGSSRKNHHLISPFSVIPHQTPNTLPDDNHEIVESTSFDGTNSGTINECGEKCSSNNSPSTHKGTATYFGNHGTDSRSGDYGGEGGLPPLALGICNLSPILAKVGFELEDDGIMCSTETEPNHIPLVVCGHSNKVMYDEKHLTISSERHSNASHASENDNERFGDNNTVRGECKEDTFPGCMESSKMSVTGLQKTGVGRRMTAMMSALNFPYDKSLESKRRNVSMAKLRRVSMGIKMHESIGMQTRERHVGHGLMEKFEALKLDKKSGVTAYSTVLGLPTHYNEDTVESKKYITHIDTELLAIAFEYLSINELKSIICTCRKWAKASVYALSSKSCNPQVFSAEVLRKTFCSASFLSDGAYKRVYRVWNSNRQAEEALSVMDTQTVNQMGHEAVVSQELHFSILSSALVRQGICPNFIQTYGICSSAMDPHSAWGMTEQRQQQQGRNNIEANGSHLEGTEIKTTNSRYCFIGMELCSEGDAEGLLRRHGVLPVESTMCVLFQALFSLYSGRSEYGLRHGDIKLL